MDQTRIGKKASQSLHSRELLGPGTQPRHHGRGDDGRHILGANGDDAGNEPDDASENDKVPTPEDVAQAARQGKRYGCGDGAGAQHPIVVIGRSCSR